MREEDRDPGLAQCRPQLLDELPGVAEHQPLLAAVQCGDHLGRVAHRADVVQLDLPGRRTGPGITLGCRLRAWRDDGCLSGSAPRALQPGKELLRVPDRGRQPDPLHGPPGQAADPFQHGQQVPAAVIRPERVHLVNHDCADRAEQPGRVDFDADQHGLERLGRGQQDVRRVAEYLLPGRRADVTMPDRGAPPEPARVLLQPGQQVVEQGFQRRKVEHGRAIPAPGLHHREQREHRRLGLAARGRC